MIAEELWKPKRAKQPTTHQMRERRACFGELVQIDGSDHDWFEGRGPKCTLLARRQYGRKAVFLYPKWNSLRYPKLNRRQTKLNSNMASTPED
jgi:hypothetical protein